jgi:hypothetical protein
MDGPYVARGQESEAAISMDVLYATGTWTRWSSDFHGWSVRVKNASSAIALISYIHVGYAQEQAMNGSNIINLQFRRAMT